ncbi:MAG: NADPH-dependent 7-cyano-7-deazaguanine reductase QueF [SAR202 cluster bacterium]|nr:NADPH-dependent 7-cyano-7-deazaguanine reductase QueF [SAR202 cluster bacterium]
MAAIDTLQKKYRSLDKRFETKPESAVDEECLMAFDYEYAGQEAEIVVDSPEFTAVCPWTGLPDFGTLTIKYVPDQLCLELKSLKYYLLSYTSVGIVQEHAANRILKDLVDACRPLRMEVHLDYNVRGGLHTTVTVRHQK